MRESLAVGQKLFGEVPKVELTYFSYVLKRGNSIVVPPAITFLPIYMTFTYNPLNQLPLTWDWMVYLTVAQNGGTVLDH